MIKNFKQRVLSFFFYDRSVYFRALVVTIGLLSFVFVACLFFAMLIAAIEIFLLPLIGVESLPTWAPLLLIAIAMYFGVLKGMGESE